MSQIIPILNFEEGYKEKAYLDTLGYPTIAGGIKIGPQGAPLSHYTFTVPRKVGDVWKEVFVENVISQMRENILINAALLKCNDARADVLKSMAYQLGVQGLSKFRNTLTLVSNGNFESAAKEMLDSAWARQTPKRARRHAEVMRSGTYEAYKGLI